MARGDWGFDGYVTSDCGAVNDVFSNVSDLPIPHRSPYLSFQHHYNKEPEETVKAVLDAGMDVDCGSFLAHNTQSALDKKTITEADLDGRLANLFSVRMRLGHFDPKGPLQEIPTTVVCSDYSKELAQDGAAQGAALIKNVGKTLPLSASVPSVAVIGPNGNLSASMTRYYGASQVCDGNFW